MDGVAQQQIIAVRLDLSVSAGNTHPFVTKHSVSFKSMQFVPRILYDHDT